MARSLVIRIRRSCLLLAVFGLAFVNVLFFERSRRMKADTYVHYQSKSLKPKETKLFDFFPLRKIIFFDNITH